MASLTPGQRRIVQRIVQVGRQVGATPKEIKAALETGRVESNFSNPQHATDHDSIGWRQERASLYPSPGDLDASIRRFFQETKAVRGKYGNSGALAAAVQRPAAQYRGRYGQVSGEAQRLLEQAFSGRIATSGGSGSTRSRSSGGGTSTTRTVTTTTPGVDNRVARASLIQSFLDSHSSIDPLDFATQARQLQDVVPTSTTKTTRSSTPGTPGASAPAASGGGSSGGGSDLASFATQRANALDAKHFSYQWGGGHGGKISDISKAVPVDCSGAVSAVLGIDPRVSGQFTKWGRPGDGGGKGVTIAANGHHVLMKINGHWFGTSASNPGGGAGWIPQSAISPEYLKGFTLRHSDR